MISIVIPTLNEVTNINATIQHTLSVADRPEALEIIVVDAGSMDGTLDQIKNKEAKVYCMPEFAMRKYDSLNYGLNHSTGEIVMFLDADTLLPQNFDLAIYRELSNSKVVGGAFEFSFHQPDWKLSLLTIINRIRYRLDKAYYGDQAIFARRSTLLAIGGVPKQPLMEAAYLSKALRKLGRLSLINPGIVTSPRRFDDLGFYKVAWFDTNMFIRFNLGLPVSRYADKYWSKNLNPK